MNVSLDPLERKVEQIVAVCASLRGENQALRAHTLFRRDVDYLVKDGKVVIVDDLLATGGTAAAAVKLVEGIGGKVAKLAFVIELGFLDGRGKLKGHDVFSLIKY